jgi:hypothetical protein
MDSPLLLATRIFPREAALVAISSRTGYSRSVGTATAMGFVPTAGFFPPKGDHRGIGMAEDDPIISR